MYIVKFFLKYFYVTSEMIMVCEEYIHFKNFLLTLKQNLVLEYLCFVFGGSDLNAYNSITVMCLKKKVYRKKTVQ